MSLSYLIPNLKFTEGLYFKCFDKCCVVCKFRANKAREAVKEDQAIEVSMEGMEETGRKESKAGKDRR